MSVFPMNGYFFDAGDITGYRPDGTPIYDREYCAADHADYWRTFFRNGVFANIDPAACLVTYDGTRLCVNPGRVLINGYVGIIDGSATHLPKQNGNFRVIVRLDLSSEVRAFTLMFEAGENELVRSGNIYDMCLASIRISNYIPTITDTRKDNALCGYMSGVGQPAYQPPSDISSLMYEYTMFPHALTPEQVAIVESNTHLRAQFDNSRLMRMSKMSNSLCPYTHRQEILTSQNWTCPEGVYFIDVFMCGAGSSGCATKYNSWGYGGAGGYTKFIRRIPVNPGTVYPITIGAGGSAVTRVESYENDVAGLAGGDTIAFGYTARGGKAPKDSNNNVAPAEGGSPGGSREGYGGMNGQESVVIQTSNMTKAVGQGYPTTDPYTGIMYCDGGSFHGIPAPPSGNGGKGADRVGQNPIAGDGKPNTGSGGGGAQAHSSGGGCKSGKGADGLVIIYYGLIGDVA